jgi:hypothetical protein
VKKTAYIEAIAEAPGEEMEHYFLPNAEKIARAARKIMDY